LQILFRLIVGIADPAIHKGDARGQIAQPRDFLGLKKVVYFQKHQTPTPAVKPSKSKEAKQRPMLLSPELIRRRVLCVLLPS
jgi:hypothetical protein